MSKARFADRYVLGEGYPWGYGPLERETAVGVNKYPLGVDAVGLKYPPALYNKELPKYRLVLERVEE